MGEGKAQTSICFNFHLADSLCRNIGSKSAIMSSDFASAGTRQLDNWRLIEYHNKATRSARLSTRSVLGAAGKVQI